MKMFENLEKLIRLHDLNITIMEEKYGDGFLFGLDIPQNSAHLSQQTFHDLINQATSPGDVDAVEVLCELAELAERYPELLFVQAETLKSYTTYHIWKRYPNYLRKHFWKEHTFWTDGYFACSVGNVSEEMLKKYIENQG